MTENGPGDLSDQDEFTAELVCIGQEWLAPMPADLLHRNPLSERLSGFVFSLLVALEGGGQLPQYQLLPQGKPDVDLMTKGLHEQWHRAGHESPEVAAFLSALSATVTEVQAAGGQPSEAMRAVAVKICALIEDGYVLVPEFFDDEDEYTGFGRDVAPGLAAAMQAAWPPGSLP